MLELLSPPPERRHHGRSLEMDYAAVVFACSMRAVYRANIRKMRRCALRASIALIEPNIAELSAYSAPCPYLEVLHQGPTLIASMSLFP